MTGVPHTCHATACEKRVPRSMFMCKGHWFSLPKDLRDRIWAAYVPGQEDRRDPTAEYLEVTREAIRLIESREAEREKIAGLQ